MESNAAVGERTALVEDVFTRVLQLIDVARCSRHERRMEPGRGSEDGERWIMEMIWDIFRLAREVIGHQQLQTGEAVCLKSRYQGLDRTLEMSEFTHVWVGKLRGKFTQSMVSKHSYCSVGSFLPPPSAIHKADCKLRSKRSQ